MAISLFIDTAGGSNFEGYNLRNVGTLHVGGAALASGATLEVTGTLKVSSTSTLDKVTATGSATASAGAALVHSFSPTLTAAANNDVLTAFKIEPTFTLGAFTGTTSRAFHVVSGISKFGGAAEMDSTLTVTGAQTFTGNTRMNGVALHDTPLVTGANAGDILLKHTGILRSVDKAGTGVEWLMSATTSADTAAAILAINGNGTLPVCIGHTTTVASASAGELVLANNKALRSVNGGATDTIDVLRLGTSNQVLVGYNAGTPVVVGIGAAPVTNASGGELTLANTKGIRWGNAGGTSTIQALAVNSNNEVAIASASIITNIGGAGTTSGSAGGELVIGNAKALRGVNAAGTDTYALVSVDSANTLCLGGATSTAATGITPRITHSFTSYWGTGAANNGFIYSDNAGNFIWHANGVRYKVAGTAF